MGKGIESWTDVDYAQAAIDMLPGTVEEIDAWMKVHKIKGRPGDAELCPIALWVKKWTGADEWVTCNKIIGDRYEIPANASIHEYVLAVDGGRTSL